jgi:hypothetical protein
MDDQKGRSRGHGLHFALLFVAAALALVRLLRIGSEVSKPDFWIVGTGAVLAMAGAFFAIIVIPAWRARRSAALMRAERPGAVIMTTYWAANSTAFFLTPGPLVTKARGQGFYIQVIADQTGIELRRPLRNVSFGTIPWSSVRNVRLEELRGPRSSRPKLVFGVVGGATPYAEYFELLPEGKEERLNATDRVAAIRALRYTPTLRKPAYLGE